MSFEIGDRVLYRHFKPEGEAAVVVEATGEWAEIQMPGEILVELPNGDRYYARPNELSPVDPTAAIRVKTVTAVVVTIRGEEVELTEPEAYALFRALDRVL